jgi:hypothetical protein
VTSPGSLATQLDNAIASGNLTMVRLLARELQAQTGRRMALPDATATLLLILVRQPELYSRAAAALLARLLDEIPTLTLPDASGLVNVLELIERRDLTVAARNLREILSPHGQERMVDAPALAAPRQSPRVALVTLTGRLGEEEARRSCRPQRLARLGAIISTECERRRTQVEAARP